MSVAKRAAAAVACAASALTLAIGAAPSMAMAATSNPCYNMAGATYEIFTDAGCTTKACDETLVVQDNSGTTNTVELTAGTYYVRECAPNRALGFSGYMISSEVHTVVIKPGETNTFSDNSEPMKHANVRVTKRASSSANVGEVTGDMTDYSGIVYRFRYYKGLYDSYDAIQKANVSPDSDATCNASADGSASLLSIARDKWSFHDDAGANTCPLGTLVVTEESVPAGMHVNTQPYVVQLIDDTSSYTENKVKQVIKSGTGTVGADGVATLCVANNLWYGQISVMKCDKDTEKSEPQGDASFKGTKFAVYVDSDNPIYVKKDVAGLITDGHPANAYGYRKYVKGDHVLDIAATTTDEDGNWVARTADACLPYARYHVIEVAADTKGTYQNSGWTSAVTKMDADHKTLDFSPFTGTVNAAGKKDYPANSVKRAGITLHKADSQLHSSTVQGTSASFAGARFSVVNKSANDVDVDGVTYKSGAVITNAEIVCDANGVGSTGLVLPVGTYEVTEVSVPDDVDYYTSGETYTVKIGAADEGKLKAVGDDNNGVCASCGFVAVHERAKSESIVLIKQDVVTGGLEQGAAKLESITFTIQNNGKNPVVYVDDDGNEQTCGAGKSFTRTFKVADGKLKGTLELSRSDYTITETAVSTGYQIDSEVITIDDKVWDADNGWSRADGLVSKRNDSVFCVFKNNPVRGGVAGVKVDADLEEQGSHQGAATLEGAEITIYNESENAVWVGGKRIPGTSEKDVTQDDRAVLTVSTAKDGTWSVPDGTLPYGKYSLRETKASDGYKINDVWNCLFEIKGPGVVDLNADGSIEEPIRTTRITLVKIDADTGETYPQGNGEFDQIKCDLHNTMDTAVKASIDGVAHIIEGHGVYHGVVLTRQSDNSYKSNIDLPAGDYYFVETDNGEGYSTYYKVTVTINTDGTVTTSGK